MFIWLTGTKIILYSWFLIRVLQKTPLSFPLMAIALAILASGFWRSFYRYSNAKVNMITLLLDLILAVLISLFPKSAGFDKLFMIYLIEGTAILPKPFFIIYAILATIVSVGSFALFEFRETGQMQLLGVAEIMLYGFVFILVQSERRQREQRLAYEKLTKELEYVNLQLNESMVLSEKLASEAERRRIAGEIHDSLGHDLTGLILTLEAGKRLMNHDPEVAKSHWDKALQVSRTALNSVRELVSEKRESYFEFELISRLNKMACEVQDLTGLQIEIDMKPQDLCLSSKEDFNLYRIFQEAITNALRHTNADRVQICISGNKEAVSFSYCDNGAGTNKIEAGNGLKGMKERIAELGGVISFHSQRGKGFKINGYIGRRRVRNEEDKNSYC
ncbi:sensor histidine kinase [Desulfosporosinus nitroreducens]|uniref:histidine kinase n=1 Tax=Desulfosporosinus nitroreducens TaxID=2018668 RepID=A0ABT8QSP0_9FIRM|nr:sensor histidine kinase [Desulfosporosinus nitroreducens]MCO1603488.1 sensor histidine kinase [Desulfosporosinus nitroreducens]MDO0824382.1 sensor histidine kinase [Desulfosporosinus nitroreducens]